MLKTLSANKLSFYFDFDFLFHFISSTAFGWGYMAPALVFPNATFLYTLKNMQMFLESEIVLIKKNAKGFTR